ncbi:DUF2917 domain-containing protein [Chitinimonas arctica]|uniref:DUF2917 domain-containing protein n=1 Tax=Chitinimonas arctica TaxID=2594795 RepID=A0A516SCF7_9NEIS|nr:DUF2917 domain-containing protein [Chitinimonas arctica]QDQ25830.1 DUF2917 domain-containing protein [Chitinimonas arctica]
MKSPYQLHKNALLNLPAEMGATIEVESGVIWLTAAGNDVILGRGHQFCLPVSEVLLVQALADSRFKLRRPVGKPDWASRLSQWLPRSMQTGS